MFLGLTLAPLDAKNRVIQYAAPRSRSALNRGRCTGRRCRRRRKCVAEIRPPRAAEEHKPFRWLAVRESALSIPSSRRFP